MLESFDPLNEASLRVLFFARKAVSQLGGTSVTPEHLLLGLLEDQPTIVSAALDEQRSSDAMMNELRTLVFGSVKIATSVEVPISNLCESALVKAIEEAGGRKSVVRPEHLLLGLLSEGGDAARLLAEYGVEASDVRNRLTQAADSSDH